jgi:thioredoxin-related protein
MKSLVFSLALLIASTAFLHADWTTDYKAALAQAKTQKKLVLLDFTGSDWCGYCQLLDKEVFTQPAFKDYADKNYIMVTVDFPQQKPLPDDVKQQNDALGKEFKIDGYPTLIVLDADGKELGRQVGYDPGSGTDAVIAKLKTFNKS